MIRRAIPDSTPAQVEAFDRTCSALQGFDGGLSFELVDGFLTALATLPQPVPAEEWLPVLCDDSFERAFGDPVAHAEALAVLQARLDVLRAQLDPAAMLEDPDELRLAPLMQEFSEEMRRELVEQEGMDPEDAEIYNTGVMWAEGFFECVGKMPTRWTLPAEDGAQEAFESAFEVVDALRFTPDEEGWPAYVQRHYPKGEPSRDDLIVDACWAVQDLRLFWVDFAPKTAQRRVEATPGRNDPCPCGSGKKFKKCHGAAS